MKFNYSKICADLISDLKERENEIISRRFALNGLERETLESIGQDFGISRERVRQIQTVAMEKIKPKLSQYQKVFQSFLEYFKKFGNLRKEKIALFELGGENWKNEVYFLLTLQKPFQRFLENHDFYSFWTINQDSLKRAKETLEFLFQRLLNLGKPVTLNEISSFLSLEETVLTSYLEISKKIQKVNEHSFISTLRSARLGEEDKSSSSAFAAARLNKEGLYGLKDWPEINPRGIKDKAYLVFKKIGKPLHFQEVTNLIENAHLQTVHNELIKDSRFVLVGRGIYALSEWGYEPGQVKEVILKILKESKKPLKKEEILEKVLSQRLVKENTILLNLSNKKYFLRDSQGKYKIKEI